MAKLIFVEEDHNLNGIKNIADATALQDATTLQQVRLEIANADTPLTAGLGIDITADVVSVKTDPQGSLSLDYKGLSVDVADGIAKTADTGALYVNVGYGLYFAGVNDDFVTVKTHPTGGIVLGADGLAVNTGAAIEKDDEGGLSVIVDDVSVKIVNDQVSVDPTWLAGQIDVNTEALTAGNGLEITDNVISAKSEDGSISVLSTGLAVNVGRGIVKAPDVGDIGVNTGDGLTIRDDKVTVRSEDGSISVLPTGLAVNVGKGIVKAPVVGDIGVNVDDVSVKIVDDKVTVDEAWLAGQITSSSTNLTAGNSIDITGDVISVKTSTNSGLSNNPEGLSVDVADGIGKNNDNGSLFVNIGDGLHFAGVDADFVTVNPKVGGYVGVDPAGVFVDVAALAADAALQTMVGGEPDYEFESPTPGATYPLRKTLYFRGRAVGVLDDEANDQSIIDVLEEMPRGGTTGQVLTKTSSTDWEITWADTQQVSIVGTAPVTVVDDGADSYTVGLATGAGVTVAANALEANVDPAGGLTKTSGATGNALAVVAPAGEGIVVDATGVSVDWTVVPPPSGDSDAANKAYVDQVAQGMVPLAAARAATTGAEIALDGTVTTVDGVPLAAGDRVLVKDQPDKVQNGVYDVVALGAWTRSADADSEGELRVGSTVFVSEGATNANASFAVASIDLVAGTQSVWTPGTDPTTWVKSSQISGYVEGPGIDITGNNVSVDAGNGLTTATGVLEVLAADASITVGAAGIQTEVQPLGGLVRSAQGPAVSLAGDSGLVVDAGGVLRVTGTGETIPGGPVAAAARTVTGEVTATGTEGEILLFTHGLAVPNPAVSVQVNNCEVTVDVCRPNINDVTIGLGVAPAGTVFTVTVTG